MLPDVTAAYTVLACDTAYLSLAATLQDGFAHLVVDRQDFVYTNTAFVAHSFTLVAACTTVESMLTIHCAAPKGVDGDRYLGGDDGDRTHDL